MSGIIRGVISDKAFPVKFSLSLGYFIMSSIAIVFYKWKLGDKFKLPWLKKVSACAANSCQSASLVLNKSITPPNSDTENKIEKEIS